MKKITLFLVAALMVAVTGLATGQQVVKQFGKLPKNVEAKKAPKKSSLQRQTDNDKQASARWAIKNTLDEKAQPKAGTRAVGDLIIYNQPSGDYVNYVRSGYATYYYWGYIFDTVVSGGAGDVVFGSNGSVYFKNLLTQYTCNTWTKGTVDGNTIKIEFPQPAMIYNGGEYDLFLGTYDDEEGFVANTDAAVLTLNYDAETGAITTPEGSDFATGAQMIGLCASNGGWTGYTDWNITLIKQTDEPVAAPEGLETTEYSINSSTYAGSLVQVGFDGDDIYVKGLYASLPEAWVKGTIKDGKATFASGQYLGSANSYHQYLVAATAEELYDDYYEEYYTEYTLSDADIVFNYDADTKKLTTDQAFLINAGTDDANYAVAFNGATIAPFTEVAATPATPDLAIAYTYDYDSHSYYGWYYLSFNIKTQDVDGNFILPEKLSYAIFAQVGGEEYQITLPAGTYANLTEDMTEVPYGFTDGWDIYTSSMYFYSTGASKIGIQAIYRGAGEERRSEIAWTETGLEDQPAKETPTYPELDPANVGSSVTFSLWDGQSDVGQLGEYVAQDYDVALKLQDEALVGTHIDKISFVLMETKGVSNIKAWLSTNLRVEGGKNAPNLVEIPVENAEAGIITVALDKPYTISEEGVYVGYSFTIDDASSEVNQEPIIVVPNAEGNLYVHSSKMYVGWTDLGAVTSRAAYIMAEVSGSSVKDNSAVPTAGEPAYVKAGEAISIPTTIVNHGANGIKSLDIDYTLNGTTTSKHIDIDKALEGTFGASTTITSELPAIAERGNYDLTVKVVKVNDADNEETAAEATSQIIVLNTVPKKRTVLEEYTGTWCGWCPRGFVALETLAELYPDEYVLVSYHNGDPMEIMPSSQFPSYIAGFPGAWIDRVQNVDPFYGTETSEDDLPVLYDLEQRNKVFGQADIQLAASLSDDNSSVNVNATVIFPYDLNDSKYALEYVLVADGLTGEGDGWDQSNYFSGYDSYSSDPLLGPLTELDSYISGLKFNDVAVAVSQIGGINGSLPETIKADEAIAHSYQFDLSQAVNTDKEPVIQDVNKLKVVALVVNTETGEVANAQKVNVGDAETGIQTIQTNGISTVTERYNAAGQRISAPQKGVNIIKLSNGKTLKVIVK